ncbi:leucine-rich repeat protein 1 isoform X5 [Notamacropus eugenii]|uniref:leucine-rich repeat protein 1 isoform X5 n=1 Tax=Notamacropus eugenii TaxID=9315 RepID=UPI003B67F0BC
MKLQCEVELVNRHLPTFGLRGRGKGTRAVLSLGRPSEKALPQSQAGAAHLVIYTLKDKAGSRYKLKENIEQFFTKFVEEGKATVRLKEPAVDVCLSKNSLCSSYHSFSSLSRFGYIRILLLWKILSKLFHSSNCYYESTLCCPHCGSSR